MANPWITHVKSFATKNHMKYGEALANPRCRSEYKSRSGDGLFSDLAKGVGNTIGGIYRSGKSGFSKGSKK